MMGDHGSPKLVMAQAIKDATMAYFMYEGILWYLKKERKNLYYTTISTVSQDDIKKLLEENLLKADFIICVDNDMTTTY